jgi:hypothetical protein
MTEFPVSAELLLAKDFSIDFATGEAQHCISRSLRGGISSFGGLMEHFFFIVQARM